MKLWMRALLPLLLLGLLLVAFFRYGPLGVFRAAFPPVEELTIERIQLPAPNEIVVHVVNGGPSPVTVAQVMVDDALWTFTVEPPRRQIPRLGRMEIHIPYPWVEGDAHEVKLLTSTGLTFAGEIAVATRSPRPDWNYFSSFSLLGIYAGVIPVFLGLLWYPFLARLSRSWLNFFLSLTAGLLFFLAVDSFHESLDSAGKVAGAFQGVGLVILGMAVTLLTLLYLSRARPARRDKDKAQGRQWTALMIAVGIGLHNLGEGLAIGSAYALGQIALGTFLVVGFTLHNLTEGLGIVTPIARDHPPVRRLLWLGAIAGVPTIFGTWIGGFSYSPVAATLFLAIGTGAMLQVIYEIAQLLGREAETGWASLHHISGFLLGLAVMYLSGLLIVV